MLKAERIQVYGLANALYGMRLPKRSNNLADTECLVYVTSEDSIVTKNVNDIKTGDVVLKTHIGEKDMKLAEDLVLAGTDHGKWLRQVTISLSITAPMTFWWDMDTYKVATVKNSSSRMHKITSRELNSDDFSWDDDSGIINITPFREYQLEHLNEMVREYNDESTPADRKKFLFKMIIQDLPDSYNFEATWTGSIQTCRAYYFARMGHKQKELRDLAKVFANLPEVGHFVTLEKNKDKQ